MGLRVVGTGYKGKAPAPKSKASKAGAMLRVAATIASRSSRSAEDDAKVLLEAEEIKRDAARLRKAKLAAQKVARL